jgi:protein SCO1/2
MPQDAQGAASQFPRADRRAALLMALATLVGNLLCAPVSAQASDGAPRTFDLVDHHGKPFSHRSVAGRPYAVFFGFTHCPDVCPTTLMQMSNNLAQLGTDAERLTVLFVTVDPERDTADRLREYMASFDARIVGLTGSLEQIAATAKAWNTVYNKVPEDDGSYSVAHAAHVYLMDSGGRQIGTLNFQEDESVQLAKLRKLIAR